MALTLMKVKFSGLSRNFLWLYKKPGNSEGAAQFFCNWQLLFFSNAIMHSKIILLMTLFFMAVSSMPTGENIPDLQADDQFLYSYSHGYGYGYPGFSFTAPIRATYHVPVASTDGVPASTAKLITQPIAYYGYPGYRYAGYPFAGGYGYAFGYPITA